MKKLFSVAAASVLLMSGQAFALIGGPFDNGDFNQSLDENGIYQAVLRFPNGQGFAQFGSNVDISTFRDAASGGAASTGGQTTGTTSALKGPNGSYLDRSVIYFKGIVYLGTCYGMVDLERKVIDGVTNGSSDAGTVSAASSAGTTAGSGGGAVSLGTVLVSNGGKNFTCNTAWSTKVTSMAPMLKFRGDGQLTVLNPDANTLVGQAIAALIAAIPQVISSSATASSTTGGGTSTGATTGVAAITAAITALNGLTFDPTKFPSAQSALDAADVVHLFVFGQRKFFQTRR